MNIIDILVVLVLAFSLFSGMYKGFIASFLSLLGLVGSWFGALKLYPAVARLALGQQTFMGVLSNYLEPATFFEDMQISGVTAQTTVSELVRMNNIANPDRIYEGQVLIIRPGSCNDTYVVRRGDTLSAIAARYGTTVARLAGINGISNADRIYVGQVLDLGLC